LLDSLLQEISRHKCKKDMAGKRTRRASQAFQPTKISEDEFTSGDKFVFTIDSPSPKGRVTRSRRSSICLNPPPKPVTKARRQTMLPAVKEMPKSPVKKKKSNVVDQLLKTPSKDIGEFYASPAKAKDLKKTTNSQTSPIKSVSAASSSVSPTKKFSKSSNRTLTELEILENLESEESDVEVEDKTPVNAKKESKTAIPAEKTTDKVDKKSKIPVKSPPTKSAKAKPSKVKTKEPTVKTTKIKKSPKNESKSTGLVKPQLKTPKKPEKVSLKNLPPGSPLLDSIFKDIKKVEIRLTPMKIKEDPNVIFDLLEEHQQSKFRVQKVVDEIVKMKKESSPQTRLNASKDESVAEVTDVEKTDKSTRKVASKSKSVSKPTKKNEKKTDSSPALKPRGRTAGVKNTAVEVEETSKNTETEKKQVKKNSKEVKPKAVNNVTKPQEKKMSTKETLSAKTGVKRALETKATPIQNKRIKLEKETPKTPKTVETPKVKKSKTPATTKKQSKTPKPEIKAEPITPVTPEVASVVSKSKSTAKKSASKKTPKLMAQYKQKTPVGSLKKPLKRLSVAKSTPAQVKPSDLLKKNLKRQVETAIIKKIGSKPDSSPYTISVTDGSDSSPVFTKVESVTSKVVKKHITGTPARTKPTRKFGTVIQPASLLEDSVMPSSNAEHKAVSSSTPLRAAVTGFDENINEPHPLESVEATPIRAPSCAEPRSPEPMMVTGGLAKMCSIM